ncbi:MAG: N-acetylmuramic acid 6-phosphate etherase [Bacteroidia bacterium]|nr:N-acetylmuramic acid 6-phosphate etherase [Bacteroidia bacterium]
MLRSTEQASPYAALDAMSTRELLAAISREDQTVPQVIAGILPAVEAAAEAVYARMREGGRLFYLGSGTSGRLGIVDASECPPTYGVPQGWVVGIIAGGDGAIRKAVEFAEDDRAQGWADLQAHRVSAADFVLGISASGSTPYVLGALEACRRAGIATGCIACNAGSPLEALADYPMIAVTGPEVVTGSTRMKAGTAQKLILNMLSTTVMIRLGRVKGSRMVDMQLANRKLVERGTRMVMEETGLAYADAETLLLEAGSVREALERHSRR